MILWERTERTSIAAAVQHQGSFLHPLLSAAVLGKWRGNPRIKRQRVRARISTARGALAPPPMKSNGGFSRGSSALSCSKRRLIQPPYQAQAMRGLVLHPREKRGSDRRRAPLVRMTNKGSVPTYEYGSCALSQASLYGL